MTLGLSGRWIVEKRILTALERELRHLSAVCSESSTHSVGSEWRCALSGNGYTVH